MIYSKEYQCRNNKVDKPKKVNHNRSDKLTQKKRGSIRPYVRQEVKTRSKDVCEVRKRCKGATAVHMAHLQSRNTIDITTANDLLHACLECHLWMDFNAEGIRFKKSLRELDAG